LPKETLLASRVPTALLLLILYQATFILKLEKNSALNKRLV